MIEPISLSLYLKIVGSAGFLGLVSQIITIFNISIKMKEEIDYLEKNRRIDGNGMQLSYNAYIEKILKDQCIIDKQLKWLLCGFILATVTVLLYAITSHIEYLSTKHLCRLTIIIVSYFFFFTIPLFIIYHLCKMFKIYYKISTLYNKRKKENEK